MKDILSNLNEYELSISTQLVNIDNIDVTFADIGGMNETIEEIRTNIIFPLIAAPILKNKSQLFESPKGVLLFGPPGCGKTMIAKATAKEANLSFINLEVPLLTDKLYGESQKYAKAVFTLAEKIQPCIIFIDEIDTFLRSRGQNDHEVTAMIKAQFMILWDGLLSKQFGNQVIVFGATNRPEDIDVAILRRMPVQIPIPLPSDRQRKDILDKLLKNESLEKRFDSTQLIAKTANFSGSDLKELCRKATQFKFIEKKDEIYAKFNLADRNYTKMNDNRVIFRKTKIGDFIKALESIIEAKKQINLKNRKT